MDLQHWFIINLERVNWEIYLVNNLSTLLYSPFKSLQFGGIKNEGLEVVETPPNPSKLPPSFLKKLPNKVIKLLSLSLLYSPSFIWLPNRPLVNEKNEFVLHICIYSLKWGWVQILMGDYYFSLLKLCKEV